MRYSCLLFVVYLFFCGAVQAQALKEKEENGLYGLVDKHGRWVVKPQYDLIYAEEDNRFFRVEKRDDSFQTYCGVYDGQGKLIIPCIYRSIYYSDVDKYFEVELDGHKGAYNSLGEMIVPCDYHSVSKYDDFYKVVSSTSTDYYEGVISLSGQMLIAPDKYTAVYRHDDYYLCRKSPNLYCIIDKNGHELLAPTRVYRIVHYAGEGLFEVNKGAELNDKGGFVGGMWGYWGNGKEIISCQYDKVSDFKDGVATVIKDGKIKLIKNPLKDGGVQIVQGGSIYTKDKKTGPAVSRYPAPNSDVDNSIPQTTKKGGNRFAFIVANENYPEAPVPYALNDGRIFKEYCQRTLGLPEKQIRMFEDATYGNLITAVQQIKEIAEAYEGEAELIFYYAGHGVPDEKNNSAYLLPVDGSSSDVATTGYALEKLYGELSQMKLKNITVFLDACFSGAKREDEMLTSARGVAIKTKEETPRGNMVVFSAATGDETAHQLEEKGHGLFTYYLLKKLQDSKGDITLGELSEYVTKQVKRQSVVINNKKQTPTTTPSESMLDRWSSIKL